MSSPTCTSSFESIPPPPPSNPDTLFSCTNDELRAYIAHDPHLIPINECLPYTGPEIFSVFASSKQRATLLQHAVLTHDIERVHILMTHPTPIDPDIRADDTYQTPLGMACVKWESQINQEEKRMEEQQYMDKLSIEMITLLCHMGSDPNICTIGTAPCVITALSHPDIILAHLLDLYHPVATQTRAAAAYHNKTRSVPCIPISLTSAELINHNIFEWITILGKLPIEHHRQHNKTAQDLTEMINRINHKYQQEQITSMHTFIMATHPRIGRSSVVYHIFRSSPTYDPHLLHLTWQFLYIRDRLPCTRDEANHQHQPRMQQE